MERFVADSGRSEFRCLHRGRRTAFPAVIGQGREFALDTKRKGVDALAINYEGRDHLVGQLAIDEDRFCSQARVKDKTSTEDTIVQLAAGAGLVLPQNAEAFLVINYNLRDYLPYRDKFAAALQRAFAVTFTRGELAGTTKFFSFPKVRVIPEGVGAFTYAAVGEDMSNPARPDLVEGTVLLLDIGSQTCNALLFREFDLIEDKSDAWDLGMHLAEVELLDVLKRPPYEYEVTTLAELGGILEEKKIHIGKQLRLLGPEVFHILAGHARKINEALSTKLTDTDRKRVTNVLLAGGGARCMIPHIQPYWPMAEVEPIGDNRWANCLGQELLAAQVNA